MKMELNRRSFLKGVLAGSTVGVAGCQLFPQFETPDLRFGVVSDIHLTTPESCALFESSLLYFRSRGVDAVMVPGDLTDWGVKTSLQYMAQVWNRVFPGNRAPDGRPVVPLFCTGNHDFEGWRYGDMTMEMHANGYSEDEALVKLGMKQMWEEIFHETWEPIRVRTVKGFDFISAEWNAVKDMPQWMAANGSRFKGGKPFFFFQHPPVKGTTSDSGGWADKGAAFKALKDFPNAVSFTGHAHHTFNDERSIWQGAFTAIATPSLSYVGLPGAENGSDKRDGTSMKTMPRIPARRDLRGGQGFVVSVYPNRIEIERRDLEENAAEGAPSWIVPWPCSAVKPYAEGARENSAVAPEFPAFARLDTYTRNADDRRGKWAIAMTLKFPSAYSSFDRRVMDYEVRVEPTDGSQPLVKRFLSPAFHKLVRYEPKMQEFWFNVNELPQDKEYVIKVCARNWYGVCSRPLVSKTWHGKPGLDKVRG